MKVGTTAEFTGVVTARVERSGAASRFVKATLTDGTSSIDVVWWDADLAPAQGKRVSISGDVKEYNGRLEVHVRRQRFERELPADPLARLVGYYLECVEAEAAADLTVAAGGTSHLSLLSGSAPPFVPDGVRLPGNQQAIAWAQRRQSSLGETLLAGFPVVVGRQPSSPATISASPLFLTEVLLEEDADVGLVVRRATESIDINVAALELAGVTREEQQELLTVLDASAEYEEAKTPDERLRIALALMEETLRPGLVPPNIDPNNLSPINPTFEGIQNGCLVLASQGGTQITRQLIDDLEAIMRQPERLKAGPLGIFLGAATATATPYPKGHAIVVPSTVRQGQAIHAALTEPFTVITGPPGTGKSQALVNVVTAAVIEGQTVLFASKNNKAVDVVVERIRHVSPRSNVMRCGAAKYRPELASAIGDALNRAGVQTTNWPPPRNPALDTTVDAAYDRLRERANLIQASTLSMAELATTRAKLPANADVTIDLGPLRDAEARVVGALRSFGDHLPLLRRRKRWKLHRERLDRASGEIAHLNALLAAHRLDQVDAASTLATVSAKPTQTLKLASEFTTVREIVEVLEKVAALTAEVAEQQRLLDTIYQPWAIEDALAGLSPERLTAGRAQLEQTWSNLVNASESAKAEMSLMQSDLVDGGGAGARKVRQRLKGVLAALPAWGVTSLSVSSNFPLEQGLFDLVVIDEASQCDIASIIPLLFRAKRALIIGDQRQLTHITQLGRARSELIARRWQVPAADLERFDYRTRSAFALAASRVGEPLMLDLHFRSQPSIITFSNQRYYGGQLSICTVPPADRAGEPSLRWIHRSGSAVHGANGKSWRNLPEADAVAAEVERLLEITSGTGQSVGVVTPFRPQADEIQRALTKRLGDVQASVTIDTAYRFQGDERDIMVFSPVVANGIGPTGIKFAGDPNLLNVALTRARSRLIVVGDQAACLAADGSELGEFARYVARLEASGFDSPLELFLFEALLRRGVAAKPGQFVSGHRLDLAIEIDGKRLDVECDGAPFHTDRTADHTRDASLRFLGWEVIRFSGRDLSRDVDSCADRVAAALRSELR